MSSNKVMIALEDVSHLIGRLDARLSLSPLAEPWQVRACILAAETLASVDGTPTRSADIAGLLSEASLSSPHAYRAAHVGLAHWRRCMARLHLSDLASRLVGRVPSPSLRHKEAGEDWAIEESLPAALVGTDGAAILEDIDAFAKEVSNRAIGLMRSRQGAGAALIGLAAAVQQAVRMDPDPRYFERVERRRLEFVATTIAEAEAHKAALPSPTTNRDAERISVEKAQIDAWRDNHLRDDIWEKPRHLGACYAVIPDRLVELGLTANRLSCLTGATKRLGFEGRLDDRALLGFLRQLAGEVRAGLGLLDALEDAVAKLGRSPATKFDSRALLPSILYAFVLLPAVDPVWLETSLEINKRVIQKLMKRLTDSGLVTQWADKSPASASGRTIRDSKLWILANFDQAYDLATSSSARPRRANSRSIDPALTLARYRDVDVSRPMALVYQEFDQQLVDIDREFGALFGHAR